jgi:putative phosphonate metabolism protein
MSKDEAMRYAIYFAPPPDSLLHELGSRWLGRDAWTGKPVSQPNVLGIGRMTMEPARYGFHATLKAPFALRDNKTPEALAQAVKALAASETPFGMTLQVGSIGGFQALVPAAPPPALYALAARCVRELDEFRAPASEEELQRRRKAHLTPVQEQYLGRWGYPYVLDDFRFHMTLTERLDPQEQPRLAAAAAAHFAPALHEPVIVAGLTLFVEDEPRAPFRAVGIAPFSAAAAGAAA